MSDVTFLEKIGFQRLGNWSQSESGKGIEYIIESTRVSTEHVKGTLYSFVIGEHVHYIGYTSKKILQRLDQYKKPHETQKTNIRINNKISENIKETNVVSIYIFTNDLFLKKYPSMTIKDQISINYMAGLESTLIQHFKDRGKIWNMR